MSSNSSPMMNKRGQPQTTMGVAAMEHSVDLPMSRAFDNHSRASSMNVLIYNTWKISSRSSCSSCTRKWKLKSTISSMWKCAGWSLRAERQINYSKKYKKNLLWMLITSKVKRNGRGSLKIRKKQHNSSRKNWKSARKSWKEKGRML